MIRATTIAELVEGHAVLARRMAARKAAHTPAWIVARDELEAVALEALWQAAKSYDPGRNVRFGTFAARRVAGAMMDLIREARPGGRFGRRKHTIPMATGRREDGGGPGFLDEVQARRDSEVDELIDHLAARCQLPELWRTILWLRFAADCQLRIAASIVGLSESRVSRLLTQIMAEIRAICPTQARLDGGGDRWKRGT